MTVTTLEIGKHYLSNEGNGPLHARTLYVDGRNVWMERWAKTKKKTVKFKLPIKYLLSDACGWKEA